MSNFFERISPRWIRAIYTVFALLVLAASGYNFLHVMFWRVPSNDQCKWLQEFSDTTRVHVMEVRRGGAADRAGLEPGDIVVAVNGIPVSASNDIARVLGTPAPGDSIRFAIERNHRRMTVRAARRSGEAALGVTLRDRIFMTLLIADIVPGGVTDRAGIRDGDILLRIDGVSVNNPRGPSFLLNRHQAGSKAEFLVDRDGVLHTYQVEILKTFNYAYFAQFLLGFGFLLVGYIVLVARPQGTIQRKFARYGIFAMYFFGFSTVVTSELYDPLWKVQFINTASLLARIIAPPIFISFFLHFPVRRSVTRRRWLLPALYGGTMLAALVLLAYVYKLLGIGIGGFVVEAAAMLPFAYFLTGLGLFVHSYYRHVEEDRRQQLRPILQSVFIGIAAFVYIIIITTTYPFAIFLQPYLLLPALLIIGIPPAFGYSIVKYRLMDFTVIVKRSLMYGLITAAIAAIYLGVVFGLGSLLGNVLGETDNQLLTLIAFVVIALMFDPLKQRLQRVIDKLFYRERYNYQKALMEFSHELPRLINLEQILSSVVNRIAGTMHVEKVSVGLCESGNGCSILSQNIPEELSTFSSREGGVLELLKKTRAPFSVAHLDEDIRITDAEDRRKLEESGIELIVPMFLQNRMIGAINVGPKMSGSVYSQEDMDLLSTVASQAAIAIENARLHRSEVEKQKIAEQLKIAQRIQQGLLPKSNPPIERLDIAGISIPAMTVGGDYYDYIELPGERLLVAVGDVSGKGVSAALYMAKVQGMIRFAAQQYENPRAMLSSVNRLIYEGIERNSFITMILALFDMKQGTVTICRAGHTQPLADLNGEMRFMGSDGMGLGLEPGDVFDRSLEERVFRLKDNGLLLLYSDGLTEAMDKHMNEFGEDRVFSIVKSADGLSAIELQNMLIYEVVQHRNGAEQNDDITVVVIRIR
ncbi:MAG: SpoIIE family protein phosphatase [Bacteroidota bacterium]|nr:SpoIIE family protein phosphatase [Bacteroidota bacterium]